MECNRCNNCINYRGKLECEAFPNGIPEEILLCENDHSKPCCGQKNDIVFEPIEDENNN